MTYFPDGGSAFQECCNGCLADIFVPDNGAHELNCYEML